MSQRVASRERALRVIGRLSHLRTMPTGGERCWPRVLHIALQAVSWEAECDRRTQPNAARPCCRPFAMPRPCPSGRSQFLRDKARSTASIRGARGVSASRGRTHPASEEEVWPRGYSRRLRPMRGELLYSRPGKFSIFPIAPTESNQTHEAATFRPVIRGPCFRQLQESISCDPLCLADVQVHRLNAVSVQYHRGCSHANSLNVF